MVNIMAEFESYLLREDTSIIISDDDGSDTVSPIAKKPKQDSKFEVIEIESSDTSDSAVEQPETDVCTATAVNR